MILIIVLIILISEICHATFYKGLHLFNKPQLKRYDTFNLYY